MTKRKDAKGKQLSGGKPAPVILMLWKDADPDIPNFVAAKSEFAKLQ